MKFINPYFEPLDKIMMLERWIIVHSCIYYELNESIVDDSKYDSNCRQLLKLYSIYPKERKRSKYRRLFKDFDGSTGFHLYKRLTAEQQTSVLRDAYFTIKLKRGK